MPGIACNWNRNACDYRSRQAEIKVRRVGIMPANPSVRKKRCQATRRLAASRRFFQTPLALKVWRESPGPTPAPQNQRNEAGQKGCHSSSFQDEPMSIGLHVAIGEGNVDISIE